ncbi:MAG: DNA-formamidopyrimidine glycosylase [Anaerolineales bacterium]|jgi:formamidopyrimidine-DNA glycosylase
MPELPEVETICRVLRNGGNDIPSLVGLSVKKARVFWAGTIEEPPARKFQKRILGQSIHSIGRRGKYIVFSLTEDTMLIHLRMSGDLRVGKADQVLGDHIRMVLYFNIDYQLAFNNPRKFGRVWLLDDPEKVLGNLGPEPLDLNYTTEQFYQHLHQRKRQIKPLLTDQGFVAGLGNIYTDEALNLAKIHPLVRSNQLTCTQVEVLLSSIRDVLKEGIHRNGASIDWVYQGGEFQNHFRVYQREGEPCPECQTPITRIIVGQRGTHLCKKCQVEPG